MRLSEKGMMFSVRDGKTISQKTSQEQLEH